MSKESKSVAPRITTAVGLNTAIPAERQDVTHSVEHELLTTFEEHCLGGKFVRLFRDCEDMAYTTSKGKRCMTVEAILLSGYLFYGQHVYQATSVVLLLAARVIPSKIIRTFNILLIRWRIDPLEGTLSYPLSCTWYNASNESYKLTELTPVA
ncbi:unnamed protein product [Phytophthora lilii]|uniref:Unnamed protein product n=1 Tax=Phytophthora lilii TaxID=2077276 RepID=A0A9W6XF80_9STRA|nr:unnamed protein product [Phytophthora lilii]